MRGAGFELPFKIQTLDEREAKKLPVEQSSSCCTTHPTVSRTLYGMGMKEKMIVSLYQSKSLSPGDFRELFFMDSIPDTSQLFRN